MSSTIQFVFVIIAVVFTLCEATPKDRHAPQHQGTATPPHSGTATQPNSGRSTPGDTDSDEKSDDEETDDEKNNGSNNDGDDSRNEETKRHDGQPMFLTEKQKKELDEAGRRNAESEKKEREQKQKDPEEITLEEKSKKIKELRAALEALQSKGTNPPTSQNPPHHPKTLHNTKAK